MEGKSTTYYRAFALNTRDVTIGNIKLAWLRARRQFPRWQSHLDRAYAVLGDPWLKFVYDSAGELGLRAKWCQVRLAENLLILQGARLQPRQPDDDTWDSRNSEEWRLANVAWATVVERRKKFRRAELQNIQHIAMVGCMMSDSRTSVPTLTAKRRLRRTSDVPQKGRLPNLENVVLRPDEPRLGPPRVKWPSTFPSPAWRVPYS